MGEEVILLHPDLGVGGAERLVVDAALALKSKGFTVSFVTSYHSRDHCFEETRNGTLPVTVVGSWIPRHLFGRLFALFAYLKMIYCALYIVLMRSPNIVICDLVSACIPFLKLKRNLKVIYYCHFPDRLLSKKGGSLKSLYRAPLDWVEERTTGLADKIYVNSEFTRRTFADTFQSLTVQPDILYPSINTSAFDLVADEGPNNGFTFLSINRYERKKFIELAIKAFKGLKSAVSDSQWSSLRLVIIGGYDPRVDENVQYFEELSSLAQNLNLTDHVSFHKSPSDSAKIQFVRRADVLVYTPPFEHFGIVPLEAMYCSKPVVACNSGGPTESLVDGETGFLCEFETEAFTRAMTRLVTEDGLKEKMGKAGRERFLKKFSFAAFTNQLHSDVEHLLSSCKDE